MKRLSEAPQVDPTARVNASTLGPWTEVGARAVLHEVTLGAYSYVVHDANLAYTTTGKFCSIAAATRLNPGNHPLDRAALHDFTVSVHRRLRPQRLDAAQGGSGRRFQGASSPMRLMLWSAMRSRSRRR